MLLQHAEFALMALYAPRFTKGRHFELLATQVLEQCFVTSSKSIKDLMLKPLPHCDPPKSNVFEVKGSLLCRCL
jgi:hypothetical protein